jgi:hypothetical protein
MISNLMSNQERWDQIVAQEARSVMAESVASQTSTSSSSNGGSSAAGPESRRQSLDPPQHAYHQRMSRSSAEGDDDSDPSSFPYMPLDSCEAAAALTVSAAISEAAFLVRRHSLPTSGSLLMQQPPEGADEEDADGKPRPSKRRPLESEAVPRVTFHFGSSPMDDHDEDKENDWTQSRQSHRRGSAPSSLLIGQLAQPLRLCSRENSPTSAPPPPKNAVALAFVSRLNGCNRRGSLPADLLQLGHDTKTRVAKKRRLLTRHQSGSAVPQSAAAHEDDVPLTSSSSSPHLLAVSRNNALSARRGSQPLAEPTTELSLTVPVAPLFPCRLSPLVRSAQKQQHADLLKCVSRGGVVLLPAACHSLGAETTLDLMSMRRGSLPTELAVVESHAVQ